MKNVWGCASGNVAAGRPVGARFRDALLGTVAAGALSLAFGGPALAGPDACVPNGPVDTCTGNQSAGIAISTVTPASLTLNVNSLTQAIAPASGTTGISFRSTGSLTINSDTGAFGINTTGAGSFGIAAGSPTGSVTVTSTGNITNTGGTAGIYAVDGSAGSVTVTSTGNISTTSGIGIESFSVGGSAITVTSTGNITTAGT